MVEIREYVSEDLEVCRDLWRDLTQRHRDIYEDPTIGGGDPGPYFDEHYLTDPRFYKLWVAVLDDEIVGLCGLLVEGDEVELEPIVVRPALRDRGVGAELAQHVIAQARALGRRWINVRPVARNIEAIAFFHREGFRMLGRLELSLPLRPDALPRGTKQTEVHQLRFDF